MLLMIFVLCRRVISVSAVHYKYFYMSADTFAIILPVVFLHHVLVESRLLSVASVIVHQPRSTPLTIVCSFL